MHIDNKWHDFVVDPKNIRFGLSIDGFNPFFKKNAFGPHGQ
jgi:hypothetical protein